MRGHLPFTSHGTAPSHRHANIPGPQSSYADGDRDAGGMGTIKNAGSHAMMKDHELSDGESSMPHAMMRHTAAAAMMRRVHSEGDAHMRTIQDSHGLRRRGAWARPSTRTTTDATEMRDDSDARKRRVEREHDFSEVPRNAAAHKSKESRIATLRVTKLSHEAIDSHNPPLRGVIPRHEAAIRRDSRFRVTSDFCKTLRKRLNQTIFVPRTTTEASSDVFV